MIHVCLRVINFEYPAIEREGTVNSYATFGLEHYVYDYLADHRGDITVNFQNGSLSILPYYGA